MSITDILYALGFIAAWLFGVVVREYGRTRVFRRGRMRPYRPGDHARPRGRDREPRERDPLN